MRLLLSISKGEGEFLYLYVVVEGCGRVMRRKTFGRGAFCMVVKMARYASSAVVEVILMSDTRENTGRSSALERFPKQTWSDLHGVGQALPDETPKFNRSPLLHFLMKSRDGCVEWATHMPAIGVLRCHQQQHRISLASPGGVGNI